MGASRIVCLILGFLCLAIASVNANRQPPDARLLHFIGGSLWAVIFFGLAFWGRRKQKPKSPEQETELDEEE